MSLIHTFLLESSINFDHSNRKTEMLLNEKKIRLKILCKLGCHFKKYMSGKISERIYTKISTVIFLSDKTEDGFAFFLTFFCIFQILLLWEANITFIIRKNKIISIFLKGKKEKEEGRKERRKEGGREGRKEGRKKGDPCLVLSSRAPLYLYKIYVFTFLNGNGR